MRSDIVVEAMLLAKGPVERLAGPTGAALQVMNALVVTDFPAQLPADAVIWISAVGLRRDAEMMLRCMYLRDDSFEWERAMEDRLIRYPAAPDIRVPSRMLLGALAHELPGPGTYRYELEKDKITIGQTTFYVSAEPIRVGGREPRNVV